MRKPVNKTRKKRLSPLLKPRKKPEQKRAEKTVALILDTSAQLLEEVGFDKFNTNLLAEHADMRVATIYRYFPNKLAILTALIKNWIAVLMRTPKGFIDLADPEKDWRKTINAIIDNYIDEAKNHLGFIAIRRAMQSAPELREIELDYYKDLSKITAKALQARGVDKDFDYLVNFCMTYFSASSAAIDLAWIRNEGKADFAPEIIDEVKLMSTSYFQNIL